MVFHVSHGEDEVSSNAALFDPLADGSGLDIGILTATCGALDSSTTPS
jgi:hypothetical protein